MKKNLILTALMLSCFSFAKTTGKVTSGIETDTSVNVKDLKNILNDTKYKAFIGADVKVKNSGLSFGAKLSNSGILGIFPYDLQPIGIFESLEKTYNFDDSNAYIKYELPAIKDNYTYLKGNINSNKKLDLEMDLKGFKNVEYGLNSKTSFYLTENPNPYTTLKGFVQTDLGPINDFRIDLETQHKFGKQSEKKGFQYISGDIFGRYKKVDGLILFGEAHMRYNMGYPIFEDEEDSHGHSHAGHNHSHSDGSNHEHDEGEGYEFSHFHGYKGSKEGFEGSFDKTYDKYTFSQRYAFGAKYTKIKDTELSGKIKLYHGKNEDINSITAYLNANAKYKGIKNTTLEGDVDYYITKITKQDYSSELKATASATYDYALNDKFTISPGIRTTGKLYFTGAKTKSFGNQLYITPNVKAVYKPNKDLKLEAKSELTFNFNGINKLEYSTTKFKNSLNISYEW